jgi:hypothetical protein
MQYADDDFDDIGRQAMNQQLQKADDGTPVRGVTQTIVGEDAKLLEISAHGISEKREFAKDLREYILEVLGGMKARAEHMRGAPSGTSLRESMNPLRRLVRRQRRPYGGLLKDLIDLVRYGVECGALDTETIDSDLKAIKPNSKHVLDWPVDQTFQGAELLAHVQGMQFAAGGASLNPIQLLTPSAIAAKLASDIGMHESIEAIKGSFEPLTPVDTPILVQKEKNKAPKPKISTT